MNGQASEHMNSTNSPISSGSPKRPIGMSSRKRLSNSGEEAAAAAKAVFIGPGEIDRHADIVLGEFARHAERQGIDGALGRRVMRRGVGSAAFDRHAGDIDDHAAAVLEHMGDNGLHGVERALEIQVERALQQIVGDVEEFRARQRGAGRIEQKIDAAEAVDGEVHHVVDGGALGDVDSERQRLAADLVDLLGGLFDAFFVDVGAHHIGALAGENQRGRPSDAAGGAGDDDGLAVEIVRRLRHGFLAQYKAVFAAPEPSLAHSSAAVRHAAHADRRLGREQDGLRQQRDIGRHILAPYVE